MNIKLLSGGGGGGKGGYTTAGAKTFLELTDTPAAYTGAGLKFVTVTAGENGLEFTPLPPLAITDTFVVASQVAMLALVAQTGDVAIRTDINQTYILQGSDPTILGNWALLLVSPTHAIGGALHTADTIANVNTKLSDGDMISTLPAEIAALALKAVPTSADLLLIEDAAAANDKKKITIGTLPGSFPQYSFFGDTFISPNNADWTIGQLAVCSADSLNNSLSIRAFNDATEQGAGFYINTPAGATNLIITTIGRAETAPGVAKTILPRLYTREVIHNTAIGAWSAAIAMAAIAIPTNTRFQVDTQTISLAALSLTAGRFAEIEITRNPADTLVGNWNLLSIKIEFS